MARRGSDDGSVSAFSLPGSSRAAVGRARGGGGRGSAAAVSEEALLALRDECQQAKLRERAAEDKMRQLAAQLMRTEEAAKRILTRTDPSARGGCAKRLLDAEREVARLKADLAEAEAQLAVAKRQAADYKRQGAEAKKRLEAALADQRRLALQLGRSGASGAGRSLAALSANTLNTAAAVGGSPVSNTKPPRFGAAGPGQDAAVQAKDGTGQAEAAAEGAAVARQFAEQQEQLVCARERGRALEQELRRRDSLIEQQSQELNSLRAQLASAGRPCSVDGPTRQAGGAAGAGGPTAASMQQRGRTSSDGSEGGEAWLRLKYLKAKSALGSVVASNTRLLRELEAAHAQLRDLQAQQAQQQGPGGELWTAAAPQPASISADERLGFGSFSDSRFAVANTSAAPGPLRQQLAAANHRAARLQIELDAAVAKLAIYQAHSLRAQQPSQQPSQPPSRQASQRQDAAVQRSVRAERVASWLGGAPAPCPSGGGEATSMPAGASAAGAMEHEVPPQTQQLGAEACPDSSGLAPHQNLVELHLHAAELAADAPLGPLGLSFCTVDFWTCDTKISALAEGRSPLFNTTLQFVVGMTAGLMEHLSSGCVRVQLHACRGGAGGSAADYDTIASADIPLACLVTDEAHPAAYRQATLLRPDGLACGTLRYALAALKPMRSHPAAAPLVTPSQAARPVKPRPAGTPGDQPRLLVDVVGCRDLRCSSKAAGEMQPYVALMLPQPGGRQPLLFESRPAAGSSPVFGQQAAFSVRDGAAAVPLEAVVFDAAAGADAQQSIIGVAQIGVPPAGSQAGGGSTQLHPLLHPTSGRHAGALEVGLRWG